MSPPMDPQTWAVLQEIKDKLDKLTASIEGYTHQDGSRRDGLMQEVDRLRARVIALEDAAAGRVKLWHAVVIGCIPTVLALYAPAIIRNIASAATLAGK